MTNKDYHDILASTRSMLKEIGLSAIDERIMTDMRGSDGPFWDLTYYMKHLTDEIALGSDAQLSGVLRRMRQNVRTESGEAIQGIRLDLAGEDRERYDMQHIDFTPDPVLGEIALELRSLIEELHDDHRRNSNQKEDE